MSYDVEKAYKDLDENPNQPTIWYDLGMELAKQDKFKECFEAFTKGLTFDPFNPSLRLQRGRKHITLDRYVEAIADLGLACKVEPEHWENWYYRGVASYMAGKYELAMEMEMQCIKVMLEHGIEEIPAPACWYWQSAMKAGKKAEAEKLLEDYIYEGIKCGNMDYTKRCYLYKGIAKSEEFEDLDKLKESLSDEDRPELYFITLCHGLATYQYYYGSKEKSVEILKIIYKMPTWHECFAYKQTLQDMKERNIPAD